MGVGVENLDAGLGNQGKVLDADAGAAGEVDARLDRERHVRLYDLLVNERDIARLVVLQTDRVPQAVRKVLSIARNLGQRAASAAGI